MLANHSSVRDSLLKRGLNPSATSSFVWTAAKLIGSAQSPRSLERCACQQGLVSLQAPAQTVRVAAIHSLPPLVVASSPRELAHRYFDPRYSSTTGLDGA